MSVMTPREVRKLYQDLGSWSQVLISPLIGMWLLEPHRVKFPHSDKAVYQDLGSGIWLRPLRHSDQFPERAMKPELVRLVSRAAHAQGNQQGED
jgi:hypothetical protein